MKNILWVGDAGCPSGFARATHEIVAQLDYRYGGPFNVTVLGINYRGDPDVRHLYPYDIYAAAVGGDAIGVGRLIWMCDRVRPDAIVLQNDGWNIPFYLQQLVRFPEYANIPVVASVAVDGKNFQGAWLDGVAYAIFWTQFALTEARFGGFSGDATVISLGVDTDFYHPTDMYEARQRLFKGELRNTFIIGNVNRNQPRKRWDLMLKYFAEWIRQKKIDNAYLFLHVAPTGDTGVEIKQLAQYYDVLKYLAIREPPTWYGIPDEEMRDTYNAMSIYASTTQGEGMGLPAMEAMACSKACLLPDWSAYGDWARGAAALVPCTTTHIGPPYQNVIGGVVDEDEFIKYLDVLYREDAAREAFGEIGRARVHEPRFQWKVIGERWIEVLNEVLEEPHQPSETEWEDLGRPESEASVGVQA